MRKNTVRCYNKDCAIHQLTQDDAVCIRCGFFPPEDKRRKAQLAKRGLVVNALGLKEFVIRYEPAEEKA